MKRLTALFLSMCLLVVFSVPLAADNNEEITPPQNERVISVLEENNIDFQIVDGVLKLVETSPEALAKANESLVSEFSIAASYPTAWTHMALYDIKSDSKFRAASRTALAAAVAEWAKNKFIPDPWKISVAAAAGFGIYYFVNAEQETLYFYIKYSYRELGPGFFDHNGTFIGDYELKKEIRVTKNSNYTGGSLELDIRKSSVIEPWY
ncbi:hypothetical protein MHI43_05235 [Paenibacillus sp. FSL H8-0457]|uniref:hypothetical protein n=1 Tax=unclassified Paenibacillus TaxID=185978 RepID=UPI0003E2A4D0|nr:hypothetical protein [Paenibacillus sp. FSL H8-457]ETT65661.1 hypothetical protein C172_11441 [Paenibacillus sp. FSL H8-457]